MYFLLKEYVSFLEFIIRWNFKYKLQFTVTRVPNAVSNNKHEIR